jgi:hypothetical protein
MSNRFIVLGGAAVIALLALSAAGRAETISYGDAVTTLANDCGPDIKKFCAGLNLGNGAIANCLAKNAAKISPKCTSSFNAVAGSIGQRREAQTAYFNVCKGDIARHCRGIKGDGYQLSCLIKTQKIVSGECNQAITNAGWR